MFDCNVLIVIKFQKFFCSILTALVAVVNREEKRAHVFGNFVPKKTFSVLSFIFLSLETFRASKKNQSFNNDQKNCISSCLLSFEWYW